MIRTQQAMTWMAYRTNPLAERIRRKDREDDAKYDEGGTEEGNQSEGESWNEWNSRC